MTVQLQCGAAFGKTTKIAPHSAYPTMNVYAPQSYLCIYNFTFVLEMIDSKSDIRRTFVGTGETGHTAAF